MKNLTISAIIFDFNGTLFYDTEFHNQAWMEFAKKHGKELSVDELELHIHGSTNREILEYIFQHEMTADEIARNSDEKEEIYRAFCQLNPGKCVLTPGAEYFLDRLKRKNVPMTIATASILDNVKFFIELFNLERWFDPEKMVYDTGKFRGKPYPDMFMAAAEKLDIPIDRCLVVEDSLGGVQAARNAGAAQIVAISNDDNPGKFSQISYVDQIITDFRQIDFQYSTLHSTDAQ